MKFTININQEKLMLVAPTIHLDEAAVLDYLYWFCTSPSKEIESQRITGKDGLRYTWINYSWLIKEMPLLGGKTKAVVTRIMQRLENLQFIKSVSGEGNRKLVALLPKIDLVFSNLNTGVKKTKYQRLENKTNHNTIYPNTKSELNNNEAEESAPKTKTDIWKRNEQYIKDNLETFKSTKYDFPDKDGKYGWYYLINHGKTDPHKLFGAIYWRIKETESGGVFNYRFKSGTQAYEAFQRESKDASKLANMFTVNDFIKKLKQVDEKYFDEKAKEYKFEWKLSTVLKNLHNND